MLIDLNLDDHQDAIAWIEAHRRGDAEAVRTIAANCSPAGLTTVLTCMLVGVLDSVGVDVDSYLQYAREVVTALYDEKSA